MTGCTSLWMDRSGARSQLIPSARLRDKTSLLLNKLFSQMALLKKFMEKLQLFQGNLHSQISCSLCSQLIRSTKLQDKIRNLLSELFSQMALLKKKSRKSCIVRLFVFCLNGYDPFGHYNPALFSRY